MYTTLVCDADLQEELHKAASAVDVEGVWIEHSHARRLPLLAMGQNDGRLTAGSKSQLSRGVEIDEVHFVCDQLRISRGLARFRVCDVVITYILRWVGLSDN